MVKRYGPHSSKLPVSTQYGPRARRQQARDDLARRVNSRYADQHAAIRAERQRDTLIRNQAMFVQVSLSGPQHARAAVGHRGQVGAWVTVTIGTVVLTFHDQAALLRYAAMWTEAGAQALQLPAWVPQDATVNDDNEPGVVVTATAHDVVRHRMTRDRTLQIVSGQITWEINDRNVFRTVQPMWARLVDLADPDTLFPHRS